MRKLIIFWILETLACQTDFSSFNMFFDQFKALGSNLASDFISAETYKKMFSPLFKDTLKSECYNISIDQINQLGIFKDPQNSLVLEGMDVVLSFDQLLYKKQDFLELCKNDFTRIFNTFAGEDTFLFFVKLSQNLGKIRDILLSEEKQYSFKIMMMLMMKQYEGIGMIILDLIKDIQKFTYRKDFDYFQEYQLQSKSNCFQNIIRQQFGENESVNYESSLMELLKMSQTDQLVIGTKILGCLFQDKEDNEEPIIEQTILDSPDINQINDSEKIYQKEKVESDL